MTVSVSLDSINPAVTLCFHFVHNCSMSNIKTGAQQYSLSCDEGHDLCLPLHRASGGGCARRSDLSRRRVPRQPVPEQAVL